MLKVLQQAQKCGDVELDPVHAPTPISCWRHGEIRYQMRRPAVIERIREGHLGWNGGCPLAPRTRRQGWMRRVMPVDVDKIYNPVPGAALSRTRMIPDI